MITAQTIYDATARFLSEQGCRSTRRRGGGPAYYGSGNRRCAIGMHIPPVLYEEWKMEGRGIADLIYTKAGTDRFPELMRSCPWLREHEHLFRSLMMAHDPSQGLNIVTRDNPITFVAPDPIVNRLRDVAREHGLNDVILDHLTWPEFWF
jgi:hypothetical protein